MASASIQHGWIGAKLGSFPGFVDRGGVVLESHFIVDRGGLKMRSIFSVICLLISLCVGLVAQQTMPLGIYGQIPALLGNNAACAGASGTVALTPGQMSQIAITSQSGALTCTTPTATLLCRLFPFVNAGNAGFHWDWYLVNAGTGTVTVALGSGVTNAGSSYTGTLTVAAGSVKHFIITLSACTGTPAAQLFSLGTSVF